MALAETNPRGGSLGVDVKDGIVTLTGRLPTKKQKTGGGESRKEGARRKGRRE
jgi:hypothetical protein